MFTFIVLQNRMCTLSGHLSLYPPVFAPTLLGRCRLDVWSASAWFTACSSLFSVKGSCFQQSVTLILLFVHITPSLLRLCSQDNHWHVMPINVVTSEINSRKLERKIISLTPNTPFHSIPFASNDITDFFAMHSP